MEEQWSQSLREYSGIGPAHPVERGREGGRARGRPGGGGEERRGRPGCEGGGGGGGEEEEYM